MKKPSDEDIAQGKTIHGVLEYLLVPDIETCQWRIATLVYENRWVIGPEVYDNFDVALSNIKAERGGWH